MTVQADGPPSRFLTMRLLDTYEAPAVCLCCVGPGRPVDTLGALIVDEAGMSPSAQEPGQSKTLPHQTWGQNASKSGLSMVMQAVLGG